MRRVLFLVAFCCCVVGCPTVKELVPKQGTVTVKDAYTSVTVGLVGPSTFSFLGTDKKYHVAYEVELQNASRIPATIQKLDVVDAADPSRIIASFAGTALIDPNCTFGNCNRLRALQATAVTDAIIPPQESRVVLVDFVLDSLDKAPKTVLHHLYALGSQNPRPDAPKPIDYVVAPYEIAAGAPRLIGPPLTGPRWVAFNGCCEPGFPHRGSFAPFNGSLYNAQRFAIDWKQMNEQGAFYVGDKKINESYVDYGSDVIAVADGKVVATLDVVDAGTPGVLPSDDSVLGPKITIETVDGNNIVLDIGQGNFAFYAHLLKGSLLVKPGDMVVKGQKIAKLGNTGNSNVSHLHFQLMDGPSVFGSNGIPYVIDSFNYEGQISPQSVFNADNYLSGTFFGAPHRPDAQLRNNEMPLAWAVVDFR